MTDTNTKQSEKPKGSITKNKKVIYAAAIFVSLVVALFIADHFTLNIVSGNTKDAVSIDASGTDIKLCGKCGEIKGSENCCNQDVVKCDKCGLIKGSPGCCKINTKN